MQPPIPPDPPRNHNTQPLDSTPPAPNPTPAPPAPPIAPPSNPYNAPPTGTSPGVMAPAEEKNWALAAHLLPLLGISFLGPLVVWLVNKEKSAFVAQHSLESLNFQIAVFAALIVSMLLMFVCVGFVLFPVVAIGSLVYQIMAAVAASNGQPYVYPISFRIVK